MHEFDEHTYGKSITELEDELEYQTEQGNCETLRGWISYCIRRCRKENINCVYWKY